MGGVSLSGQRASTAFQARVALAWQRYLRAIRSCSREEYEETEEAAWRRLQGKLAAIESELRDPVRVGPAFDRTRAR